MKRTIKILAIAIATLGVVTTSCSSKRDDENPTTKYSFVGDWKIMAYIDSLDNVQDYSKDNYSMQFNADKSYFTDFLNHTVTGHYTYDGQSNIIITTFSNTKINCKITHISATELEIHTTDQDGATQGYKLKKR